MARHSQGDKSPDSNQDSQPVAEGIKAVLFDRDGTLLDLQATWAGAFYFMIKDMCQGQREQMARIADYSGYNLETRTFLMNSRLLMGAPSDYIHRWAEILDRPYDDDFLQYFADISLQYCDASPTLLPGVALALEALRTAGMSIGIATNGTETSARKQMAHLGLEEHFCFIVGYDSGHGKKPDPGQVLGFATHLSLNPCDILMVGDSLHDIHAGAAAGSATLGVSTGACTMDELALHADQVIACLSELPLLLGLPLAQGTPSPRPAPYYKPG